jgi:hypothetical protein
MHNPRPNRRGFFIVQVPQYQHDRGYAASREAAMGDFKARWMKCKRPPTEAASNEVAFLSASHPVQD